MKIPMIGKGVLWTLVFGFSAACSTTSPPETPAQANPGEVVPTRESPSATGNPSSYEVFGKRYYVKGTSRGYRQRGLASWYGPNFHGKRTSSGVPFDMYGITAAHKSLPIPTYARVTRLDNGRSIVVKINDRGPFVDGRIIDLSYGAARALDMTDIGTAAVEVVALPPYQSLPGFVPRRPETGMAQANPAPVLVEPRRSAVDSSENDLIASLDPGAGSIYLQVGAFSQRVNAERLRRELSRFIDHPVRIDTRSGGLHKVWLGPLPDRVQTGELRDHLASLGIQAHSVFFD